MKETGCEKQHYNKWIYSPVYCSAVISFASCDLIYEEKLLSTNFNVCNICRKILINTNTNK